MANPKVFFDITVNDSPVGRIVMEVRPLLRCAGRLFIPGVGGACCY